MYLTPVNCSDNYVCNTGQPPLRDNVRSRLYLYPAYQGR